MLVSICCLFSPLKTTWNIPTPQSCWECVGRNVCECVYLQQFSWVGKYKKKKEKLTEILTWVGIFPRCTRFLVNHSSLVLALLRFLFRCWVKRVEPTPNGGVKPQAVMAKVCSTLSSSVTPAGMHTQLPSHWMSVTFHSEQQGKKRGHCHWLIYLLWFTRSLAEPFLVRARNIRSVWLNLEWL